jgi:hypothetical protein
MANINKAELVKLLIEALTSSDKAPKAGAKKGGRPRKHTIEAASAQKEAHKAGREAQGKYPPKSKEGVEAYKSAVNAVLVSKGQSAKYVTKSA